ncbi:hypothetical protein AMTR_s00032p00231870 [Amborella trichopoda]|uniref:Cytochrome P450 n=1 Tax=Amborella trichopoda TaxID=13333 RepID=U5CYI3_AMBTC|nr:hypothetical protein AMTR_s00032p00231870 [Amborella trichopoda]
MHVQVLWTTYGTHYDPQYFPNPESFDPNRFEEAVRPYVYLPFGGGPRLCARFELAKMQILVFMHMMVTKYDWSLVYLHEPITIDPLPAPLYGMPINIYERNTKSN